MNHRLFHYLTTRTTLTGNWLAWLGAIALLWALASQAVWAQPASDATTAQARQLWQLLDYVAVDYREAVDDAGSIVNEGEYEEMLDFSATAQTQIQTLPEHAQRSAIASTIDTLRQAVERKAPPAEVGELAQAAADLLAQAYPFPMAPNFNPDIQLGARLYAQHCASCHGDSGAGDGPAGEGLDPEPIAFTEAERADARSLAALYQVITQGVEGTSMVSYEHLSEADRWALAFYSGILSYDQATTAQGESLWQAQAPLRQQFADMGALTTATAEQLAKTMPAEEARATLAYLRQNPQVINAGKPTGIALSRLRLQESMAAFQAQDHANAMRLALSAYLDGFEPLEPAVAARDKPLMIAVESAMLQYRAALGQKDAAAAQAAAGQLEAQFLQVERLLQEGANDTTATFLGAFTILLREGLEALLIVIGTIALLRRAKRTDALSYVHAGWVSALVAGGLTWLVATYLVEISGASRELTEGIGSVLAAVILLSVGLWMHSKSSADRWQEYLDGKLQHALGKGSLWGLFALSFIAVYREVFETVLFYTALAADGHYNALAGGGLAAVAVLVVIAWLLLKTSARMPIGKFFNATSILVGFLAVVLIGKGASALQEAGWLGATPWANAPRMEWLGIYPTAQTITAQLLMLAVVVLGFGYNYWAARQAKAA